MDGVTAIDLRSIRWRAALFAFALATGADLLAQPVKIGFIGLRHGHSWRQLQDVTKIAEADFVGVAESIPGLVEEARRIQPDVHYASDYEEFVRSRRPQVVWAFVENNRHLEIVEFLAPLGVHVIFEKPLAGSYSDAVQIQKLARKHGIKVMTNYQMAWWPSNHELRRQVTEGRVGKVWRLHGVVGNGGPSPRDLRRKVFFDWLTDPEANGAGALVDFGIYGATWAAWLKGVPSHVSAVVHSLQPDRFPKVEDNAVMLLSYPDAVAILEGSWDLPRGFQQLELFGTSGSLSLDRTALAHREGRKPAVAIDTTPLAPPENNPIRYMIDRVSSGEPLGHIVALDVNVNAVQILAAAKRSAECGCAVQLPLTGVGTQ